MVFLAETLSGSLWIGGATEAAGLVCNFCYGNTVYQAEIWCCPEKVA